MPRLSNQDRLYEDAIRHTDLMEVLRGIEHQLSLLNTRFEEAFRTNIATEDITNGND